MYSIAKKFFMGLMIVLFVISIGYLISNNNIFIQINIVDNKSVQDEIPVIVSENSRNGIYVDDIYIGENMTFEELKSKMNLDDISTDIILKDETIKLRIRRAIYVFVYNPTDKIIDIEDGIICGICSVEDDTATCHLKIYDSNENHISCGSTRKNIISIFGEPDKTWNNTFFYDFGLISFKYNDLSVDSIYIDDISSFYCERGK